MFMKLMSPGCWLMRKLRLPGKVSVIALVFFTPLVLALIQSIAVGSGSGLVPQAWLSGVAGLAGGYLLLSLYLSLKQDLGAVTQAMNQLVQGDLRLNLIADVTQSPLIFLPHEES